MSAPLELSLVIPVYNERDNLPVLVEEIGRALAGRGGGEPYEIVAVDDGSTDGSLDVLKALKREHPEIHIVAFAANAGQTAAFAAGFGAARGRERHDVNLGVFALQRLEDVERAVSRAVVHGHDLVGFSASPAGQRPADLLDQDR